MTRISRPGAVALAAAAPLLLLFSLAPSGSAGGYGFDDATATGGLAFRHASDGTRDAIYTEIMGPGVCVLDYDGDGFEDFFLVNSLYREDDKNAAEDPRSHLYRGHGDGTFTETAVQAGAAIRGWHTGCAAGDYDDDGDPDLYASAYGLGTLLRNDGGVFTNATAASGIGGEFCAEDPCWGMSAAWVDYDKDGDLDLYRVNYNAFNMTEGGPTSPGFYAQQDAALWRNDGDGTFTDVTLAAGVRNINGNGLGIAVQDYDRDGWPDLFVANDETPDSLYRNLGNGTFEDVAPLLGVDDGRGGMGTAWGDYDLDGRPDLTITHYYMETFALYHHEAGGGFTDQAEPDGLNVTRDYVGWGAEFVDVDNDGWPDVVFANGHVSFNFSLGGGYGQRNLVMLNNGDGTFRNATAEMGAFDTDFEVTRGLAFLDANRDGYVDWVAANNGNENASLYLSQRGPHNFLDLALAGDPAGNGTRDALGALVKVTAGGRTWTREVQTGSSYLSQSSLRVHAGLGAEPEADLEVTWPSGAVQTFADVAANRFYHLTQGGALVLEKDWPLVRATASATADVLTDVALAGEVLRLPAGEDPAAVQHTWDFGDGTTATGREVTHRYAANGVYRATYRATDSQGRWDEAVAEVRVVNLFPEARIAGPATGTRLDALAFDGSGSSDVDGTLQAYAWTFGDGTTGSGARVTHQYLDLGTFTVRLTVTDADGSNATATHNVTITNLLPTAEAGPGVTGNTASALRFDGSASADPEGPLAGWFWDFGDGASANGQVVQHTYPAVGTYTVTLTVVDADGGTAQDTATANINALNAPPQAAAGPDQGVDRLTDAVFRGHASQDPDGTIVEHAWDFGDGTVALGPEVRHRYAALGTFTVTLTVRDDEGATGSDTAQVVVRNLLPTAAAGPPVDHEGLGPVAFDGSASRDPEGGALQARWDFGDGGSASGLQAQHTFARYGRFASVLTVTDPDGGEARASRAVWVYAKPVARAGPDAVTDRLTTLAFDGSGSSDADGVLVRHRWDFGDGAGADGPMAQHRYAALGTYRATLTVEDDHGFVAVDELLVEVRNLPPIPVLRGYGLANVHQALTWDGGSSWDPDGFLVGHAWTFTDGGTAAGQRPTRAFTAAGSHEARLAVRDNDGGVAEGALAVQVVTWLQVAVAMDQEEWMVNEDPTGEVEVRFANGLPLKAAGFALNVTYKVKPPRLNQLPEEIDVKTVFLNLTTDGQGRARFTVPSDWPGDLAPLLPTFHLPTIGHDLPLRRHMGSVLVTAPVAWQGNAGTGDDRYYVRTNDLDVG